MWIDSPSANQKFIRPDIQSIEIGGWAVSNDSNASLQVIIDEKNVNSSITRFERSDVDNNISANFGGISITPKAGFNAIIDISTFSKGMHEIKVREVSRYGDVICELFRNINIENKKYSRKYMD